MRLLSRVLLLSLLIIAVFSPLQAWPQLGGDNTKRHASTEAAARLPQTNEEIDAAMVRIEQRLAEVRLQQAPPKPGEPTRLTPSQATAEEMLEADQLLQQWVLALDQHARHLHTLKEIRRINRERTAERDGWRGFVEPPTVVAAEQLIDAVSARRLELRTTQMLVSILEGQIARYATRLAESDKELRLAKDRLEAAGATDARLRWLLQQAQLRNQSDAASIETAEIGRLVTWEALEGQRQHLAFLESKVTAARSQALISQTALQSVLAQINHKREGLRKELLEAAAADKAARAARDEAGARVAAGQPAPAGELKSAAEVAQARVETSGQKIEILRGFLQLADHTQTVWEDRVWATQPHSLRQLQEKQRHYAQLLQGLDQWKALMEQSLSALSDQVLRQALNSEDQRLSAAQRDGAKLIHATLQERATLSLRAVGALVFTEDLTARLHAELTEQVGRISIAGKARSLLESLGNLVKRIWNTELYIAEDSVIAGGQKVSIPRSITLGKVVIALSIFGLGVWAACGVHRLIGRFGRRRSPQNLQAAEVPAKAVAAMVAAISLLVAMASVRIPWTVFAFMGGALAIGAGFGAQALINNFISGLILLCERSLRVGDIVEVDDQRGKVMRIGFRNSLVERGDGIEVLVPNSQFLEKKVVNWTLTNDLVRYTLPVGVPYGAPPGRVTELLRQAAEAHPHVIQHPAPDVLLNDFGTGSMIFTLQFWMHLSPAADGGRVRSELRHRIHALLQQAGIEMSSTARDLNVQSARPLDVRIVASNGATAATNYRSNHRALACNPGRI